MKHCYILFICLVTFTSINAQQDKMVSQYMFNGLFLNPAYTGSHQNFNMTLLSRKDFVSVDGAPTTFILSGDVKIPERNYGLGGQIVYDRIGVTEKLDFFGNYAYHVELAEYHTIALGLRAGLSYYHADLDELTFFDEGDKVFMQNQNVLVPNFGTGIYYYTKNFYAGVSIPTIIDYDPSKAISLELQNAPRIVRHYFFTSGYAYEVTANLMLKPSFLIRYVDNAPVQGDINLNALIAQKLWLGVSYRTSASVLGIIEFQVKNNFKIGYAYDYQYTELNTYSAGSHEIILSYDFVKDISQVLNPRYF